MDSINIGKIIGFALGIYVIAYVLLDAVLAVANKTGFAAGSSLNTLATTVLPILSMVGGVWLVYRSSGLE